MVDDPAGVLGVLEPRTRTLGLVLIVVDLIFGVAIFGTGLVSDLGRDAFLVAVGVVGVLLLVSTICIYRIEMAVQRSEGGVTPSAGTPSSTQLDALINGALQTVCRAASLPQTPESAGLRAFIFQSDGARIICRYFWAANPTQEEVGRTQFLLDERTAAEVAVVRCVTDGKLTRMDIRPLSSEVAAQASGSVEDELSYVLAVPIRSEDGRIWGTVDFDTSTDAGCELLSSQISDAAMHQLARLLQVALGLREPNPARA
jgi:hypothetical protein